MEEKLAHNHIMAKQRGIKTILKIYDMGWHLCIPMLRLNSRLKDGFDFRRSIAHLKSADLWLQAASAGEAYLASSIIKQLKPKRPINVMVTTNTRQGLDIINKDIAGISTDNSRISVSASFFPFDRPALMEAAVRKINPRVMVLLETEIWPGLLAALKKNGSRIFIINGRLTPKSLHRYMQWRKFLQYLGPDKILAISKEDAGRFGTLFGQDKVSVMRNIKFDQLLSETRAGENRLQKLIPPTAPFLVYGSIREQEEPLIENIINDVSLYLPETITGLFPRHLHRIDHWETALNRSGLKWRLRSSLDETAADKGTIILWDRFGELNQAYSLASAVFVGGSLVPLGGQNFLEPLICGIKPVLGPYWDNFAWVGKDIISESLVIKADNWQTVSATLIRQLQHPEPKKTIRELTLQYIKNRMGGTEQACRLIEKELNT
jgi:3-deoxy-D-manno-octulosonic-acid transferase